MRETHEANLNDMSGRLDRIERAIVELQKVVADIKFELSDLNVPKKGLAELRNPMYGRFW
ncbi:hypothetical protein CJP73_00565 [Neopusillimonas maritima]|uniref:SlyX protein n=1 Tax=Neopusillimonas maritima TaxID=2026239 RepID=A0A3A1YUN8_9BURK|nr:hypothetical protein CJP73_00565 [Neopusillimonas maritima]